VFLSGQPHLHPKRAGPSVLIFLDFLHARTQDEKNIKFCMVIKLDVKKILRSQPRMLTRDLFAVADHLVNSAIISRVIVTLLLLFCAMTRCKSKCPLQVVGTNFYDSSLIQSNAFSTASWESGNGPIQESVIKAFTPKRNFWTA